MLVKYVVWFLLLTFQKFSIANAVPNYHCDEPLFEKINVTSFSDVNRYIRLNISWEKPIANFTNFKIVVETNCSAIYDKTNVSIYQSFIIEPKMEIEHPADRLLHGCKYDFELYSEGYLGNSNCIASQMISYEIPDCVDTVCDCSVAQSPYDLKELVPLTDHTYEMRFANTDRDVNVSLATLIENIWYVHEDDNTETLIHHSDIEFNEVEYALTVPFRNLQRGKSYKVFVKLTLDTCVYYLETKIQIPAKINAVYVAVLPLLLLLVASTIILQRNRHLLKKLKKYLPFLQSGSHLPTHSQQSPNGRRTKEIINSQYTPLEFLVNSHKFDHYEIPRNKIIVKNEIGGGAFGKVYRAEVYGLNGKPGYVLAAAKKPLDHAPPEEIADFLAEIEMMKKIAASGGHRNVIQILASVTMDAPYIMVMELVLCGSLKAYLTRLRGEWDNIKMRKKLQRNARHFFPDHMIIENYVSDANKLKYTDLVFNYDAEESDSPGTGSYITPESAITPPSSPESSYMRPNTLKLPQTACSLLNGTNSNWSRHTTLLSSPLTPQSVASSVLPSETETLLTSLESPVSPLVHISEERNDSIRPLLDNEELQNFSMQIANGMAYLESIGITHRDLAARNILINENRVLKISDFGMAKVGVYVNTAQKRQPLRWMAPEAIENRTCDSKTDVWSFGVVLWEIASLGAFPYKNLSNEMVIVYIAQGKRLERPETCTEQIYNLMQKCWYQNPEDRPTFKEIAKQLDISNGKIYVDFSRLSPKYVFPPIQEGPSPC